MSGDGGDGGEARHERARRSGKPRGPAPGHPVPGQATREAATALIARVLNERQAFDDALAQSQAKGLLASLEARDHAHARLIAATVLRRLGQIDAVLGQLLTRGLPRKSGLLREILRVGAAQLLFLETPAHAAIDIAVRQAKCDRNARRFDKLVNAVLRGITREGADIVSSQDAPRLNTPDWLWRGWSSAYGEDLARGIATANQHEAALDLTVRQDAAGWAERLGGQLLPTGTVRIEERGRIERLEGFEEGAWWVQDAAAALPARILGDVAGLRVLDLCAAPGGKTAQLAHAGARVTALDISEARLGRLRQNMARLRLNCEIVTADAATWTPPESFDAVLLDAPCLATGTIRRHPDIPHLKSPADKAELAALQARLLDHACNLVRPGGVLVYCTCSLEPEEGPDQITALLERTPGIRLEPVKADAIGAPPHWFDTHGQLRTLPCHLPAASPRLSGLDGFFAARLVREH